MKPPKAFTKKVKGGAWVGIFFGYMGWDLGPG